MGKAVLMFEIQIAGSEDAVRDGHEPVPEALLYNTCDLEERT